MNKKQLHETDQAIEMTARALGELDTSSVQLSAQPSANGNSATHKEAEFEQVRELGRVIRDSSSHDTERWANPDDASRLKNLIDAEFASEKVPATDHTGQMRLAALAATILLMAGIGYVLIQSPRVQSAAETNSIDETKTSSDSIGDDKLNVRAKALTSRIEELNEDIASQRMRANGQLNNVAELAGGDDASSGSNDSGEGDVPQMNDAIESTTDAVSPLKAITNRIKNDGELMAQSDKKPLGQGLVDSPSGDIANGPVEAREFDQQAHANDLTSKLSREQIAGNPPAESGAHVDEFEFSGKRRIARSGGSDLSDVLQLLEPATKENLVWEEGKEIIGDGEIGHSIDLAQNETVPVPGVKFKIPDSTNTSGESEKNFSLHLGVIHENGDAPIVMDPNGTTVPLPRFAGTSVTSTVDVPDGGTFLLGGTKSMSDGRISDAFLATADSDIPFSQDSFGAEPPQFGGFGESSDDMSRYEESRGEFGFRPEITKFEKQSAEQYELPPENRFLIPVAERALSTFSIDVDTASYANIRRFITNGQLPPGNAVRIEEMVNYFSYDYPQPVDGTPFSVSLDVAQCPWQPANKLVRVGIQGREIPRDDRPASNLVFLIDVSGSMSDANKLPLLQSSMLMLVDQLTENDRVSIVTYASDAGIRLQPTSGDQKQVISDVIKSLSSGGSTHGSAGITTAYELATQHFIEGGTNRVLLATDGDLNVGVTDDDSLVQLIKTRAESGVFLSVLGFGTGNLKDGKLEKIADNGNGQYCYIDSIREAQKVLVAEMSGSLVTIAKDVKLQIEFNPAEVAGYRLIGYENRALNNEDFANDRVDAGDIGAGHSVTAFYEIVPVQTVAQPKPAAISGMRYQRAQAVAVEKPVAIDDDTLTDAARTGELMIVALRFKRPESNESELLEVTVKDLNQSFDAAPADFKFAASVAAYGMKLRQSSYAGNWTWFDIENTAVSAIGDDLQGHRAELVDLVRQTRKMLGR